MKIETLIEIFTETSRRLAANSNSCGNLIYPQEEDGTSRIRESEARYAMAKVLEEKNVNFMFEAPTQKDYIFTGQGARRALTDIQINPFKAGSTINIELKHGHNQTITKDLEKLLGEPEESVEGCAIFHILQPSNRGTLGSLEQKYKNALPQAMQDLNERRQKIESKWFILFVFVRSIGICRWMEFDDIAKINPSEFNLKCFKEIKIGSSREITP